MAGAKNDLPLSEAAIGPLMTAFARALGFEVETLPPAP